MTDLADQIVEEVVKLFLKGSGDDKTRRKLRSVHPKPGEWTILAAVIAIDSAAEKPTFRILSMGAGLKVMPDAKIREKSHGGMVHDCHAEILALRSFNAWLIQECKEQESFILEKTSAGISLRQGWQFALYVSELPCGDCSMSNVIYDMQQRGEDITPWTAENKASMEGVDRRGRGDFSQLGAVRTKPGRPDSPMSLSKSCSDKISVRQFDGGLLNCISSLILQPEGFYIKYLIIPHSEARRNAQDLQRCFRGRFGAVPDWFRYLEVSPTHVDFPFSRREGDLVIDKEPSHLSLSYCDRFCDVIVQGVKDGRVRKGNTPVERADQAFISRVSMSELAAPLVSWRGNYSRTFKSSQRKLRKEHLQRMLGGWTKTHDDDFTL